jgi:hypothetical protein
MYTLNLYEEEVLLLDGKVNGTAQIQVNNAKLAAELKEYPFNKQQRKILVEIVERAKEYGKLTRQYTSITHCGFCGRKDGYYQVRRTTKYKQKGEPDYNKPKVFGAYDYDSGFVRISNRVSKGGCLDCVKVIEPVLKELLKDIPAELPPELASDRKWKKYDNQHCTKCDWRGHEGEMGNLRTLMGDGYYKGKCPKCGAENGLFNTIIKTDKGFTCICLKEQNS